MQRVLEEKLGMVDKVIGKTLAGKYLINEEWRRSGLGKIYHGTHLLMDKPVALKILSPSTSVDVNTVNKFSAEARTVSSLSHPNVLNVTDFGSDHDGMVYIVLEDGVGEILKDKILRDGRFSVEHAVTVARQTAAALSAAHSAGVVHHRLTSANILLAQTTNGAEIVKVMDFGAAHPDSESDLEGETAEGDWEYASPEQNAGLLKPDERADIYSLGVILYEMLAGGLPYTAATRDEILTRQTENPPPPLSASRDDLTGEVEKVVLGALAINPDMRYQKADALAEDLAHIAREFEEADELISHPSDTVVSPLRKNNIWKTAFAVLAGISLLTAALIYLTYTKRTEPATQLATDSGALPVQPLNPATGVNEQNLVFSADDPMLDPNSSGQMPEIMPGGDGYNPWANGGAPPPGAPVYPSGGQVITIPGDGGSQFMPNYSPDGQIILIPVPVNTPSPTPKPTNAPAGNAQPTPAPKESPANSNPDVKQNPPAASPDKTPASKPAENPKNGPPSSSETKKQSGKEQDTDR